MKHRLSRKSKTLWYLEKCWRQVLVSLERDRDTSFGLLSQLQEMKNKAQFGQVQSRLLPMNRGITMWILIVENLDFPEFSRNFQLIHRNMVATNEEMKRIEEAIRILKMREEPGSPN
ncbi:unnamed protein product [Caenorhabditis brenneri]